MKTLTEKDIKIELIVEFDDMLPVRGNVMTSGDNKIDKQYEDYVINRINNGDVWAWASVDVIGTYKGLTASDYLGGCTYESEDDFKNNGYYADMVQTVLNDLNWQISDIVTSVAE